MEFLVSRISSDTMSSVNLWESVPFFHVFDEKELKFAVLQPILLFKYIILV